MRKLYRNKKALSTVISTILMIMVVMVGMSVAFASIVEYSQSYQAGIGGSVLEFLTVENVWQDSNSLHLWVYNAGTEVNLGTRVDMKIATIYVDGTPLLNNQDSANNNKGTINFNEKPVNAGQHVEFIGDLNQTLQSGNHQITVVTTRGSNFKASFKIP